MHDGRQISKIRKYGKKKFAFVTNLSRKQAKLLEIMNIIF